MPRIWSDIEIDTSILKSLFKGRIEPLDNMKVNFRKLSSEKGSSTCGKSHRWAAIESPTVIWTRPHCHAVAQTSSRARRTSFKMAVSPPDERLAQRCREHSL